MQEMNQLTAYTLRLGDNCLVLSQRLGEWCGHAPELEIDLALANIRTRFLRPGTQLLIVCR